MFAHHTGKGALSSHRAQDHFPAAAAVGQGAPLPFSRLKAIWQVGTHLIRQIRCSII